MTASETFNVPIEKRESLYALAELVGDLQTLGLLGAKDFDKAQKFLNRADEAESAALSHGDYITAHTHELGEELATSQEFDLDLLRSGAAGIAERTRVLRICEATWLAAAREAKKLVYAKSGQYRHVLNTELTELAGKAADLAGKLAGITSAEAAIAAGKVDEWTAAGELVSTHEWLTDVIGRLREVDKLDKPRNGEGGQWWSFRTAPYLERGGFRAAVASAELDGGRARLFKEMAAGPWVPTRDEALEAAKAHEDAQIAYQSGRG
ncbi:hypothetical protein O4328_22795 [Rhodococcus opacus]|uniref:DUF222 domain-containing protein n=1 Tax=Rhodococcus opacus TaxID=37919 RepID=A0AAX3Y6I4_RHOOP|nr:hypothetical protein [Rhodococcus opacus]MCZ4586474.1 hypothetical protein [Rhodococcus opacus]WLF45042.1 hypothetical protein Q5707_24445 [Rhodococcus opacus]